MWGACGAGLRRRRGRSCGCWRGLRRILARLPKSADVVVGDLREPEGLRSALEGCDALVHVAADYRLWVPDPEEMYKANVEGTRELLRLAREAGVRRVVYTSSVATMGFQDGWHDRG